MDYKNKTIDFCLAQKVGNGVFPHLFDEVGAVFCHRVLA